MAFGIGAIIGAVTGAAGYIAHAIISGNWSWGQLGLSVLTGALIGGLSGGIAPSSSMTGSAAEAFLYAGGAFVAGLVPSADISVGNWGFSISPSVAFGAGKGPIGIGVSGGYRDKNFGFSVSSTARKGGYTFGGGVSFTDGITAGLNYFGGKDSQFNWLLGYNKGDFRFSITNDAWVGGDKYRTAAAEIGLGDYSFGFNLYTTEPPYDEYKDRSKIKDFDYESPIWRKNEYGTYSSGERVFAGMYFGIQRGNHVQRIGVDAPFVQDLFQNGIHRHVIKGPYFNTNFGSGSNIFIQNFTHNPWTLYSK